MSPKNIGMFRRLSSTVDLFGNEGRLSKSYRPLGLQHTHATKDQRKESLISEETSPSH